MEYPFFRSHWNDPFYSVRRPTTRGIPVQTVKRAPSPRVVTIPVRYVGSEPDRAESTVKIQKAVRGFLVRKSVGKIAAIKKEVDEIEKRVSLKQNVEQIRKDSKERLRVNETLMSLLIRLDSIRGLDPGVREYRKSVIKKAIALQDAVDAIVAGDESPEAETVDAVDQSVVAERPMEVSEMAEPAATEEGIPDQALQKRADDPEVEGSLHNPGGDECDYSDLAGLRLNQTGPVREPSDKEEQRPEAEPIVIERHQDAAGATEYNNNEAIEQVQAKSQSDSSSEPEDLMGERKGREEEEKGGLEADEKEASDIKAAKSRQLFEKMMEENERMMTMMKELFERNEMQTRLLNSLSQRVEQLEKAFVCDKLRRKKKGQGASGRPGAAVPDPRKAGKK